MHNLLFQQLYDKEILKLLHIQIPVGSGSSYIKRSCVKHYAANVYVVTESHIPTEALLYTIILV